MHRPSPRLEGVEVILASKRRLPDGSVWLNQYRVCEKLASSEGSCCLPRVHSPLFHGEERVTANTTLVALANPFKSPEGFSVP